MLLLLLLPAFYVGLVNRIRPPTASGSRPTKCNYRG